MTLTRFLHFLPFRRNRTATMDHPSEARRARETAIVDLARTEARGVEVRRVVRSLREWREENHIVPQLERIFYGG